MMFDFGEDLTIESYRVPWLIWIQLIVMFLLIILLYSFSIFALDLPNNYETASSSSSSSTRSQITSTTELQHTTDHQSLHNTTIATTVTTSLHNTKVGEDIQEAAIKDATHFALVSDSLHPCHYLGLARQAFLKCLGLDSLFESSSDRRKRKDR